MRQRLPNIQAMKTETVTRRDRPSRPTGRRSTIALTDDRDADVGRRRRAIKRTTAKFCARSRKSRNNYDLTKKVSEENQSSLYERKTYETESIISCFNKFVGFCDSACLGNQLTSLTDILSVSSTDRPTCLWFHYIRRFDGPCG